VLAAPGLGADQGGIGALTSDQLLMRTGLDHRRVLAVLKYFSAVS
jgi:hypothetical protein